MAEWNRIRFLLCVSLMILPTQALYTLLTDGVSDFKYKTYINVNTTDEEKRIYNGVSEKRIYWTKRETTTVILYITSYTKMTRQVLVGENRPVRLKIADQLSEKNYELLYLGVRDFTSNDERIIGEFILETVKPHPEQLDFIIETIREEHLNWNFSSTLKEYAEHPDIYESDLRGLLGKLSITEAKGCKDVEEGDNSIQNGFENFPNQSLSVIFTDGVSHLWYTTDIKFNVTDGRKFYLGRTNENTYFANRNTIKVILYITSHSKMTRQILKRENWTKRLEIVEELSKASYEVLYLGVKGFTMFDTHLIGEFILETVKPNPEQRQFFTIETIGEDNLDRNFVSTFCSFEVYEEHPNVCGNNLRGTLEYLSIAKPKGRKNVEKGDGNPFGASEMHDHSVSSIRKKSRQE